MLIFWDEALVFLATPKAGSTAVGVALESLASASLQRPAALKHTSIGSYSRHVGPWLSSQTGRSFTTVALMREPVDWIRSWYRFKLRDDHDDQDGPGEWDDFSAFVDHYASPGGPARLGIGSQANFLSEGPERVDQIFRYEDMDRFVEFLEARLGCAIELPRINVPPSVDVHLDPQAEGRLRDALSEDLALYASL